jgi:hypothetical protein
MIETKIKNEWIEEAKKKAKDLGTLKHSFMKGDGNIVGFLGEIVVANCLKAKIENTYDYDLIKNGLKIDVKSKRCNSIPKDHYECSIPAYNTKQKCDYYIFVRIYSDLTKAWILGLKKKTDYLKEAIFYKKGFVDETNGMQFKDDAYNLPISKLVKLQKNIDSKQNIQ